MSHRLSTLFVLTLMGVCLSTSVSHGALVGHYTFDDANNLFADSSAFANHGGTLSSDPAQSATAIAGGGALSLDGNDSGQVNAIADNVPTLAHTISAWINTTATNRPTFVAANTSAGGNSNMLFIEGGANANAQVFSDPPGSFTAISANPIVNDGQYHHVAWVRNGLTGDLYVDGIFRVSGAANYVRTATDRWSIGQEFDGGALGDFWNGLIDDVQVYDTALNSRAIAELFANPGRAAVPEPATMTLGLLGLAGLAVRRKRSA